MKHLRKHLISSLALTLAQAAHSGQYNYEVGVSHTEGELLANDFNSQRIKGEVYFGTRSNTHGPLAEMAFLSQASILGIAYIDTKFDNPQVDNDGSQQSAWYRGVFGQSGIVEVGYSSQESNYSDDIKTKYIALGAYFTPRDQITLNHISSSELDYTELALEVYGVRDTSGNSGSFNYNVGMSFLNVRNEGGVAILAGATYYFSEIFGIGYAYEQENFDLADFEYQILSLRYFINTNIETRLEHVKSSKDINGEKTELTINFRF